MVQVTLSSKPRGWLIFPLVVLPWTLSTRQEIFPVGGFLNPGNRLPRVTEGKRATPRPDRVRDFYSPMPQISSTSASKPFAATLPTGRALARSMSRTKRFIYFYGLYHLAYHLILGEGCILPFVVRPWLLSRRRQPRRSSEPRCTGTSTVL